MNNNHNLKKQKTFSKGGCCQVGLVAKWQQLLKELLQLLAEERKSACLNSRHIEMHSHTST